MLEVKGIYKTFNPGTVNEKHALNGVNLTMEDGDFITVIGGNGAGKSTLMNAIAGAWPIDAFTRAQARCIHRPCVPGSDDGHRRHHGH